jgi:hypothetical protein
MRRRHFHSSEHLNLLLEIALLWLLIIWYIPLCTTSKPKNWFILTLVSTILICLMFLTFTSLLVILNNALVSLLDYLCEVELFLPTFDVLLYSFSPSSSFSWCILAILAYNWFLSLLLRWIKIYCDYWDAATLLTTPRSLRMRRTEYALRKEKSSLSLKMAAIRVIWVIPTHQKTAIICALEVIELWLAF